MRKLLTILCTAVVAGFASARLGLGPCPKQYPKITNPFTLPTDIEDGRYYAYSGDAIFLFAYKTLMTTLNPNEKLDCWAASMTKTASGGFNWKPDFEIPSLKDCRKEVKCNAQTSTCNCYVTAKPWEVVYYDSTADIGVAYQCQDLKYVIKTAYKNLGEPDLLKEFVEWIGDAINNFHYSGFGVMTKTLPSAVS
jgi:hypothetical protein